MQTLLETQYVSVKTKIHKHPSSTLTMHPEISPHAGNVPSWFQYHFAWLSQENLPFSKSKFLFIEVLWWNLNISSESINNSEYTYCNIARAENGILSSDSTIKL